ncbi:hypothetical protein CTAYLR_003669 [Chrysophaeum taylorii]|uniref:Uncharacterized protein n=1 Tax=Chrysophaeum taylorii TaxID=2483200 RepID=A0AAD7UCH2_9STRA|nr:hypothetical protein CTAYLR_003669 [Chrysophaeum taylorii]
MPRRPYMRRWCVVVVAVLTAGEEQQCKEALFAIHWTHIPKAGGTAMANLARRVACGQNPGLARVGPEKMEIATHEAGWLNPCCVPSLCLSEISCFASSSTCPFVQGIGRHTSSMTQLVDMACCSREWYDRTGVSFYRSAFRPAPSDSDLELAGIWREGDAWKASTARAQGLLSRLRSHLSWPMESRVAFFARMGVTLAELDARADETGLYARDVISRPRVAQIWHNFTTTTTTSRPAGTPPDDDTRGPMRRATDNMGACHRAAQAIHAEAVDEQIFAAAAAAKATTTTTTTQGRRRPPMPLNQARRSRPCCGAQSPGANSMTLFRMPFTRLASAYYYRGHSPNSDNYNLRPGVFRPAVPRKGDDTPYARFSFRDFVELPEYQNIFVKLFGDSHGCRDARRCDRRPACAVLAECHAYRNATLEDRHLVAAFKAIERHAFVGLLEAYNASTKLAMRVFGLEPAPDGRDFEAARSSYSLERQCSGALALRLDPHACRGAFFHNALDFRLYEKVHRLFCARLGLSGLLDEDPEVRAELRKADLCGEHDFSDVDFVCGRLARDKAKLDRLWRVCPPRNTRTWAWGFGDDDDGG